MIERRTPKLSPVGALTGAVSGASLPAPPPQSMAQPSVTDLLGLTSSSTPTGWHTVLGNAPLSFVAAGESAGVTLVRQHGRR